ncbi:MAG: phosphoribosylformylglycinamidine synthase [Chlorobi bacterium]|nr:phosphoribosylformylglycinamidine synthase [Chlorobiota bacterium]
MIFFFEISNKSVIAVQSLRKILPSDIEKLNWLFGRSELIETSELKGFFVGPRKEMITPWSTNAVEITQNMGIAEITRIEEFFKVSSEIAGYDPMLQVLYKELNQEIFSIDKKPDSIIEVEDIKAYNKQEGLALNNEEISYLENLSNKLNRKLTDSEVFGFSQVNSEHCRHKIFNGTFIIDGEKKDSTLFQLIKKTTLQNKNKIVSAYKDNCSFATGPKVEQFAPATQDKPDFFVTKEIETILSLKAETHNFPTTVEPFNGAATGTGGEIRDRIAGGKGALPIAGTAVYMTSYPRLNGGRPWEKNIEAREWLYQTPEDILIKASNGASDFGNKFGQPLICGSLLTFEHVENNKIQGYDKVVMLAGGIGFGKKQDTEKDIPEKGDLIIVMGGDNYRIGMGGGAVSSVATGEYNSGIELNAVQRANPEMQKRVYNAIRALAEADKNPIVSIHDHGAGGHLNCLSELVEATGGKICIDKLPVGDSTLSAKEIIGNESQERMGLVVKKSNIEELKRISIRERAPLYIVGEVTKDYRFVFEHSKTGEKCIDLHLADMFGNPPKTILTDKNTKENYKPVKYNQQKLEEYIEQVLQLESVACKDWLTNKVDRSVTGRIAKQQCAGEIQLPLNNLGVIALDYRGKYGLATSLGHAPAVALIDAKAGSVNAIAEALTNIIWAPLSNKMKSVSLSANWMWPAKNAGEDARLYNAVKAASDFALELGINIPTGKDSLSMTQKYDNDVVYSPGTVIISASAEVNSIKRIIEPVLKNNLNSKLLYIDFSKDERKLGGSSFGQIMNKLGDNVPTVKDGAYFKKAFNIIQNLISEEKILAGHDISAGGMITTLLEMCFATENLGLNIDLTGLGEPDNVKLFFSENPGIIIQVENDYVENYLTENKIHFTEIGKPNVGRLIVLNNFNQSFKFDINKLRDIWFKTSYLLDDKQTAKNLARVRFQNYKNQKIEFRFNNFKGTFKSLGIDAKRENKTGIKAAIIREKGVNGDREMAYAMYLAGMDVKDVHMTDLISGRETLEDIKMIVFVGGFSNSDVLGSAKGWAGAFKYNEKARIALENFYKRNDTLSLGVCNGCQLMVELDLVYPEHKQKPKMLHNDSGKFESAFLSVEILENSSVMLQNMKGMKLGIWVAHGEGKFKLPKAETDYHIPLKYSYEQYPGNPNGSDFKTAAICSEDGRHLAMMPHLERAFFPWQCANYPEERLKEDITPWMQAFVNAREWMMDKI